MSKVFTPLMPDLEKRLTFNLEDVRVISGDLDQRGVGEKAIVEIYDETYRVIGIDCSLENCACDAYIEPVTEEER